MAADLKAAMETLRPFLPLRLEPHVTAGDCLVTHGGSVLATMIRDGIPESNAIVAAVNALSEMLAERNALLAEREDLRDKVAALTVRKETP